MGDFDIATESFKQRLLKGINDKQGKKQKEYIKRLQNCLEKIKKTSEIKEKAQNNRIKWSQLMGASYSIINLKDIDKAEENLTGAIIEAYQEVLNILSELQIIDKVNFSITYISDTYEYARLDGDLSLKNFSLQRTSSKKGNKFAIRIKESSLREQIENAKRKENFQKLNRHFKNYIQMFIDRENEAAEPGGTNWKINKGVLAEVFERHLENQSNQIFDDSDFESRGRRWTMYRQSSGSDPFWTGPDTKYAQVKTTKASLISNVDTVLNAVYGMIYMIKNPDQSDEQILNNIFKQKNVSNEIDSEIWETLEEKAQEELKEQLSDLGFTELALVKKQGRRRKNTYIQLN